MKLFCLLILSLSCSTAFTQRGGKASFKENQADSIDKKLKNIIVIGVGSAPTRVFLDDFSDHIISGLNEDSVSAKYYFAGNTFEEGRSGYDSINKEGIDAVLFLLPKGQTIFNIQGDTRESSAITSIGPVSIKYAKAYIHYDQDFKFLLCVPGPNLNEMWTATVSVTCSLGKSKIAKKLAEKLLSSFKNHKYIK